MNFSDRLKRAMSEAGYTQGSLAKAVGMAQSSVNKLLKGAAGSRKTVEIASVLNVSPEWLATGSGGMKKDNQVPDSGQWGTVSAWDSTTELSEDEVEVPFLKDIEFACGDGRIQSEDHNGFKLRFSKSTLRKVGANTDGSGVLCFPARGNSMEPNIPDGTTVAVNTNDKKIVDGKMYAISQNGWNRIKLLYRTGPDTVSIRSYNNDEHPAEEKPISSIEIIGRVFWWSVIDY
ncbi:helix-turn-helix transcriptional regulator [Pectobacterium punjabense]|uniref:LexA family transcriptional regulator n=1 Tax=Pectobacterium punjabense TaxID=2108399 RepID=UPI00311FCC5A